MGSLLSGTDPGLHQQPLPGQTRPAGGHEDAPAPPGKGPFPLRSSAPLFADQINPLRFNQVDPSDPRKAADLLLKTTSLYNEDVETETAVFEVVGE